MNKRNAEKVSSFLDKEFNRRIGDVAIFQHEDGTYEFFNKYWIKELSSGYKIIYKYNSEEKFFSSLKNAVSWCIFDSRLKLEKTKRIEYLDKMIAGTELNIQQHRFLAKKAKDLESKLIYLAKLSEDQNKRKSYLAELSKYLAESKRLQAQNFAKKDK